MSIKEHVKSMVKSVILLDKRRNRINMCNRAKLRNMEMSILSSNCAGGVMSHDLGLPFRSQFVNLALRPKDFVKYLRDLDYYNSLDVIFPEDVEPCWGGGQYPVGRVGDVTIHFVHYTTPEEAREKWNE